MNYLTHTMCEKALGRLKSFHSQLKSVYENNDMEFLDDLGRRNILMSKAQEKYFAAALKEAYPLTISCGLTGQPDIVLPDLNRELECKITSKHKGGSWSLQSDYETLKRKGSLDYLYVLCDKDFEEFAVFHFIDLDVDDFRPLSPGARGKVAMRLSKGLKKCNVLFGSITDNAQINLAKAKSKLEIANSASEKKRLQKSISFWKKNSSYSFNLASCGE